MSATYKGAIPTVHVYSVRVIPLNALLVGLILAENISSQGNDGLLMSYFRLYDLGENHCLGEIYTAAHQRCIFQSRGLWQLEVIMMFSYCKRFENAIVELDEHGRGFCCLLCSNIMKILKELAIKIWHSLSPEISLCRAMLKVCSK